MRRSQADKDVDATVGTNIRRFREISGISQKKLGDAIGVTFQQIQKYDSGKDRISASRLVETARALGCDLNSLFAGIEIGDVTLACCNRASGGRARHPRRISPSWASGHSDTGSSAMNSHARLRESERHSFWIPSLAGKMDVIPGRENRLVIEASKDGTFRGQCAEFCGWQHARSSCRATPRAPGTSGQTPSANRLQ